MRFKFFSFFSSWRFNKVDLALKQKAKLNVQQLEDLIAPAVDIGAVASAFQAGQQVLVSQADNLMGAGLSLNVSGVKEGVNDVARLDKLLADAAKTQLGVVGSRDQLVAALGRNGFQLQNLNDVPDANGNVLTVRKTLNNRSVSGRFSPDKIDGFRYWDQSVNGSMSGTVPVSSRQGSVDLIAGVDFVGGQYRYWLAPQSSVGVKGLTGGAGVSGTVNIGELKNVKASGRFDIDLNAFVKFRDLNNDGKIRTDELQNRRGASGDIDGVLRFNPTFQARVADTVPFTFTGQFDNKINNSENQLFARLSAGNYEQFGRDVALAFLDGRPKLDLFAGLEKTLNTKVPFTGKTLGDFLGGWSKASTALAFINPGISRKMDYNSMLTRLNASGIKFGLTRGDASATLDKLMKGEKVDLISQKIELEADLKKLVGLKGYDIKIAEVELGLISGSVSAYIDPSLKIKAKGGFGMDTTGAYMTADTAVTLNGGVSAGFKGEAKVLTVLPLGSVSGGLKLDANLSVRAKDPTPGDGKVHFNQLNGRSISQLLGTNFTVDLKGEAKVKVGGSFFGLFEASKTVWEREWQLARLVDYSSDGQRPVPPPANSKVWIIDNKDLPKPKPTTPPVAPPRPTTPPVAPPRPTTPPVTIAPPPPVQPPVVTQPLTRVENLRSTGANSNSFVIQWNDGRGETRYEVLYSENNGQTFQRENVPANATRATITGLRPNVSYVVKVVSVSGNQRVESNTIRVRTGAFR